ncbi:MAG: hypothetical protein WBO10_03955 [Pyrinomonadaceae bacterium]
MREASRHLLICGDCRDLLPNPSRKEFLESVFLEQDDRSDRLAASFGRRDGFFSSLDGFRQVLSPIAGVAILILVTAGLSFLILLGPSSSTDENLVASVVDNLPNNSDQILQVPDHDISQTFNTNSDQNGNSEPVSALKNKKQNINGGKPKGQPLKVTRSTVPVEIATRGAKEPCDSNESITLETAVSDDGIRLTWGKVAMAAKYSVYISDLDERLVDLFESDRETSYVSKANFDRDIVYKWRLVVTLNTGETVVGASMNFTPGELNGRKRNQRSTRLQKGGSTNLRCVENK